jgi:DNA-binding PadR family transcriptional regulator
VLPVELALLLLLAQQGSLASEQVAAHLGEEPHALYDVLRRLRDQGLVDVLAIGELEAHSTNAASYWRLTGDGYEYLARLR